MHPVQLSQLLEAREQRLYRQQELLQKYGKPLISLSMNIPGPVKRSPLIELAFDAVLDRLPPALERIVTRADTGCEAIFCCDRPAEELKRLCQILEEESPVGRLYDLDVITPDGEKLSRAIPRTCLVCGKPAFPCARSRAHSLEELTSAVHGLLTDFAADHLADLAVTALREEVELTPKPGLVDAANNGSHPDMDLPMFYRSAEALRVYFREAVLLGLSSPDCAPTLQQAGLQAEQAMYAATGGVNTHKGAVYGFGLLLCAMGSCLERKDDLFQRAAALAKGCKRSAEVTHGSIVAQKHGAGGARAEAQGGFPSVQYGAQVLAETGDPHVTFLSLLLRCTDTNLLYRGGQEGLDFARSWAQRVLDAAPESRLSLMQEMDQAFIERHLSPGGTADLYAMTLLLDKTRSIWT